MTVFFCVVPCRPCYHSYPTLVTIFACLPKGGESGVLLHTTVKESGLMGKEAEKLHQLLLNNPLVCTITLCHTSQNQPSAPRDC